MSVSITPSKRQQDRNFVEPHGKEKFQKQTGSFLQNEPWKSISGSAELRIRLLCPASKIGSFTEKDGSLTPSIQQQTGAAVEIQELVPGCDERVVVISFNTENKVGFEESKNGGDDKVENGNVKKGNGDEQAGKVEDKETSIAEKNPKPEKGELGLSLQTALLLIFDRITKEEKTQSAIVLRILVSSVEVGCILGKGGSIIKQMASTSGAQIRIIPRDKLPPCVSFLDELVQIEGEVDAVRKGLQSVTKQILGNSSHGPPDSLPESLAVLPSNIQGQPYPKLEGFPQSNRSMSGSQSHDIDYHSVAHPIISRFQEGGIPGRVKPAQEMLSFRLLCRGDRIGALIGVAGQVIQTIRQDTGCDVKVLEGVPDSEDRVVVIAGPVHPDDRISVVQDAVLRVQSRIARAGPESVEQGVIARLLVSSNQIGHLLGKGGSVIAEMRKFTRAHIHVLPKDLIPKCAVEDEEVVQINGDFEAVQEALVQITTRLQNYFFGEAYPSLNTPTNPAFSDQPLYPPPYFGKRELSPSRMYSNHGPSFHKLDPFGITPPQRSAFHLREDRGSLIHDIHRFGDASHISDRRHWGPQGLLEGSGPSLFEFAEGQRRVSGFVGNNHLADIIPSTTVEVVVPRSVVSEIYGEDGECLKQIREFSDAKITITESKPEEVETTIVIYGTPEQTNAAQSLIQAFVISETESA